MEVEEDAPFFSRHLSQSFACLRVLIIAEPEERFTRHDFTLLQSQLLSADPNPLPGLLTVRNVLGVVIVMRQVLIEVGGRRTPVLLWLACKHGQDGSREAESFCVATTQTASGVWGILATHDRLSFMRRSLARGGKKKVPKRHNLVHGFR